MLIHLKVGKLVLLTIAVVIHIITPLFFDKNAWLKNIYIRDQFVGVSFLLCCSQVV